MNIMAKIRSWFSKKENANIIPLTELIRMPKKEDIKDLDLLDRYKDEIINILSNKGFSTSLDINIDKINKEHNIITELIVNLSLNTKDEFRSIKDPKEYIEFEIDMRKISLILNDLNSLREKVKTLIVSLNEVLKERTFMLPNKKKAIKNKISQLLQTLYIINSEYYALSLEKENFLKHTEINEVEKNDDYYNAENEIFTLLNFFNYTFLSDIPKKDINEFTYYAFLTYELERLALAKKDKKDELFNRLNEISKKELSKENKDELLEEIVSLENDFQLLYYYGRNIIKDEDLWPLYELKFNILTFNIDYNAFNLICDSKIEYENYKKIISLMLEQIHTETALNIDKKYTDLLEAIFNKYKYNSDNIINEPLLLNLLLAAFNNDLYNFFEKFTIKKNDVQEKLGINIFDNPRQIRFSPNIPLSTICLYFILANKNDFNDFVSLYAKCKKEHDKEERHEKTRMIIPEGIAYINIDINNPHPVIKKFWDEAEEHIVVFPSTLKEWSGPITHEDSFINGLELNNGLKKLDIGLVKEHENSNHAIIIPPSLEHFNLSFSNGSVIVFKDFMNSSILIYHLEDFVQFVLDVITYTGKKLIILQDEETGFERSVFIFLHDPDESYLAPVENFKKQVEIYKIECMREKAKMGCVLRPI